MRLHQWCLICPVGVLWPVRGLLEEGRANQLVDGHPTQNEREECASKLAAVGGGEGVGEGDRQSSLGHKTHPGERCLIGAGEGTTQSAANEEGRGSEPRRGNGQHGDGSEHIEVRFGTGQREKDHEDWRRQALNLFDEPVAVLRPVGDDETGHNEHEGAFEVQGVRRSETVKIRPTRKSTSSWPTNLR